MKVWIQAFRLRTLPLAFSCILMGTILAMRVGAFDISILILCFLTTLFLQILSNLANDYGDTVNGADSEFREGPERAVQTGAISIKAIKKALVLFTVLSLVSGVLLLWLAFGNEHFLQLLLFLALGLFAIWAAIKYTAGANPYGYSGFGDIAVLFFFGLVGVLGTAYLYTNALSSIDFLPALSCGLFATGVLNVNNIRDIKSDELAGKRSIPVRIGGRNARFYHWSLLLVAMIATVVFTLLIGQRTAYEWLFLMSYPLFILNGIRVYRYKEVKLLDPLLKQLALSTLVFVLLFGLGVILSR